MSTGHEVPTADRVTLDRLEIVLGDGEDATEVVDFIRAIDKSEKENNLDIFGVFCPGNLNVDNLLFCCSSYLETRLFCSSMVFKSVTSMCFGESSLKNMSAVSTMDTLLQLSRAFLQTFQFSQSCSFLENLRTN